MAFQQEVFRQFISNVNAQVMTATQKGQRHDPRFVADDAVVSRRVPNFSGWRPMQGGFLSPAPISSLNSTSPSSRPPTTPCHDEGLRSAHGSKVSYSSSTDDGGSPLAPQRSPRSTVRPSASCSSEALASPSPVIVPAADSNGRSAGVNGSSARADPKGRSQHTQAPGGQRSISNDRARNCLEDGARTDRGPYQSRESQVSSEQTYPCAPMRSADETRSAGTTTFGMRNNEQPTLTSHDTRHSPKRRKLQHWDAFSRSSHATNLDTSAEDPGAPLQDTDKVDPTSIASRTGLTDPSLALPASLAPGIRSLSMIDVPPETEIHDSPNERFLQTDTLARLNSKLSVPALGHAEKYTKLPNGDSTRRGGTPLCQTFLDTFKRNDGHHHQRSTAIGISPAAEQPSKDIPGVKGELTSQKSKPDQEHEHALARSPDESAQNIRPLNDKPDSSGGGSNMMIGTHEQSLPSGAEVATSDSTEAQHQATGQASPGTPQAAVAMQTPEQTIPANIQRRSSHDESTSSLSSIDSDELAAPNREEPRFYPPDERLSWRNMIQAVLSEANRSGLTAREIAEKIKQKFPHYSHSNASKMISSIWPTCSQNFHKLPPDPTSGKSYRFGLSPPLAPLSPNVGYHMPKKPSNQRRGPTTPGSLSSAGQMASVISKLTTTSGHGTVRTKPMEASASATTVLDDSDSDRPLVRSKRPAKSAVKEIVSNPDTERRSFRNTSHLEAWWDSQANDSQQRMKGLSLEEFSFLKDTDTLGSEMFQFEELHDTGRRYKSWQDLVDDNPQWGKSTPPAPDAPYLMSQKKKHFGRKAALRTPKATWRPIKEVKDALMLPNDAALFAFHGRLTYRDVTGTPDGDPLQSETTLSAGRGGKGVLPDEMAAADTQEVFDERHHCIIKGRIRNLDPG